MAALVSALTIPAFAASDAARQLAFARLHGAEAVVQPVVERMSADLTAALALPAQEAGAFLTARTAATLADFPGMPSGFRAMLGAGLRAAGMLTNVFHVRTVLVWTHSSLIEASLPWADEGPGIFGRLARAINRRALLPNFDHEAKLAVLRAGLIDLPEHTAILPSALHAAALDALEGSAGDGVPAAAVLVISRGVGALVVEQPESGRNAFLRVGLVATGENTTPAFARATLVRFASIGAGCNPMPEVDRARLKTALGVAAAMDDDAAAVAVLRGAFELMLAANPS